MRRLGLRSWRGIGQAVTWTFTTAAGWRFLGARGLAVAVAFWVLDRYGNGAFLITIPVAVILLTSSHHRPLMTWAGTLSARLAHRHTKPRSTDGPSVVGVISLAG
ncbi:hypothetical protein Intca_2973 [Intrasporangium calvum DSM 43043]|uniref:Uncharacterized protein n=1 Tax=Intrasporangium calvum (strain ATCC 23552 / DSM 43043 / JCM 3097 / NBRC 12989 / NCIMB 10167 / NRRL B-3866 / 7 KIP) TaxID=710696 RepID=E6SBE0_INTC7|nr:hypothetical protein Intca_2973 [Intrasporangium calvum DSM 43043]